MDYGTAKIAMVVACGGLSIFYLQFMAKLEVLATYFCYFANYCLRTTLQNFSLENVS